MCCLQYICPDPFFKNKNVWRVDCMKSRGHLGQANRSDSSSNRKVSYRANREEAKRVVARKGRRRRRSSMKLYYFLLALLIVATGVTLSLTVFFHIQTITVEGSGIYSDEEIIEVAGVEIGRNLFLCDAGKAEKRLEVQLPYIENAAVVKKLPTGINIKIEEAVIAGQVAFEGNFILIREKGKVLDILPEEKENVTVVLGLEVKGADKGYRLSFAREQDKESLFDLQKAIKTNGFADKINYIEFVSSSEIVLLYDNRIKMKIGAPSAVNYKLEFAKRVIDEKIGSEERGTLDLSLLSSKSEKASFIPEE